MLDLIREYGTAFKISFSISGTAMEQLQQYAPEVITGFRQLAKTGCVEFLAETYSHSLASLGNREEFIRQVKRHSRDHRNSVWQNAKQLSVIPNSYILME